ncbi:hypothetical protein [Acrocarpospora pleiomorpha]|uniref:hypothetical protein n=1 Tax=Acrocarpospora pleiomorpha TaxID=90975 RepID=UPI0012D2CB45|nr:hypothetical protein [Acrocarpospora pleiomorpha]
MASPVETQLGGRNYISDRDKQLRSLQGALRVLSGEGVQLVSLPGFSKPKNKYENFELLDEGGARRGSPELYKVPRSSEAHFVLPCDFFRYGWIHVLDDSEITFLMMLTFLHADLQFDGEEFESDHYVSVSSSERLLHFGMSRDAYEAHWTLRRFGLIDMKPGKGRFPDGRVRGFDPYRNAPLHRFRLLAHGFGRPALGVVHSTLSAIRAEGAH